MNKKFVLMIFINLFVFQCGLIGLVYKNKIVHKETTPQIEKKQEEGQTSPIKQQINYTIETPRPSFLNNEAMIKQLSKWHEEAPKLTEVGTYGKTSQGKEIHYIRVTNFEKKPDKVVLITACIHGNEPLCSSTVMNYIGTILDQYGDDPEITALVDSRDIYFVPIVSPDSFPHSRHVDGVDPNRDFPTSKNPNKESVPPIKALQEFFLKINPNAVISGHTFGRVFLTPWGDQMQVSPNESDYQRVIGEMARMCRYRIDRACNNYGHPIYGSEVDWYYRHGAFSVVMEFGLHQRIPSQEEINTEFERTFKGVLFFVKEAPDVEINKWVRLRAA